MSPSIQILRIQPPSHTLLWGHAHLSAVRWTLGELLALVVIAAIACQLAATGNPHLAFCFFGFASCTRVAIVEYSILGSLATGLVMMFGISLIFMATFWMLN